MDANRLQELLAAIRPGDADQGLSEVEALELRELLADDHQLQTELSRLGAWDDVMTVAMDDVAVPAGLADRLRATVDRELVVTAAAPSAPTHTHFSRRRWLALGLSVAAALLIAVGLGSYLRQPTVVDVAKLQDETIALTSDLDQIAWEGEGTAYPAGVFPSQLRFKPQRWARVGTSLDRQAIVFDLVRPGAPRAVLVAMQTTAASEDLPNRPSMDPASSTGHVSFGAWQQDGYIYSLVVSGGKARYQLFLRESGSLTANW